LAADQRERLDGFTGRLSEPGVLGQLLQSVDEATAHPREEDLGELFKELRPAALETVLVWLPKLSSPRVRELLEASADRLAETNPNKVLELLRAPESEALVSAIGLCRRLKLQGAVPGLGDTLGHADPAVRLATVHALASIGTPGALNHIERAVDDPERDVRLAAVREVGRRGFKGALKRIEPVVQGKMPRQIDLTERMAFFEAFALIGGGGSLGTLSGLLIPGGLFRHKEAAETRACAALAIGKIKTPEARDVLQKAAQDKELVVRNAVSRALREIGA
jgi:HEAT repeat protein